MMMLNNTYKVMISECVYRVMLELCVWTSLGPQKVSSMTIERYLSFIYCRAAVLVVLV